MEFDNNKPIYLQIADGICEQILQGRFKAEGRIPSVREWAAAIGVNPNTVARSYDTLSDRGIIYNTRGIGYSVSIDAIDLILAEERKKFTEEEVPAFIRRAQLLGLDPKELIQ